MNDFLSGIQVGANLYAQAKQLQEARTRSMLAAREMMVNMQAARALDAYRQQQIAIQQAQERRAEAEFQQMQRIGPFAEQTYREMRANTPYGIEQIPEDVDMSLRRRAFMQSMMMNDPRGVAPLMAQEAMNERYMQGIEARDRALSATLGTREKIATEGIQVRRDEVEKKIESAEEIAAKRIASSEKRQLIAVQKDLVSSLQRSLDSAIKSYQDEEANTIRVELDNAKRKLKELEGEGAIQPEQQQTSTPQGADITAENPRSSGKFIYRGSRMPK